MNGFLNNIVDNPILTRELRRRMRGKGLIYSILTYIVLMAISTVLITLFVGGLNFGPINFEVLARMQLTGVSIYSWITGIQILLVLIIAPTITAGMTTGEKERQTFDFLRVTTITRWMYVMGCFLSTAFYVALALICALPLLALSFLYGGVSLPDVTEMFFYLLGASCVLSSFGLFISSVCDRTRTAQGIVVFLVFVTMFGGMILWSRISAMFAGAAAAQSGPAGDVVYIFNYAMPSWLMTFLAMIFASGVLLLLSARKLFEPTETRSFAHWQFALLSIVLIALYLGTLSANPFTTELPEIGFLLFGFVLLMIAVQTFAVGRMAVGDEMWHLKRVLPWLRPIDQTIPFLAVVALAWMWVLSNYDRFAGASLLPTYGVESFMYSSIASFAFFCFVARAATSLTLQRTRAAMWSLTVMLTVLIAVPLVGGAMIFFSPSLEAVGREIMAFSPIAMAVNIFNNPQPYNQAVVGKYAAIVFAVLTIGVAAFGETRRYLRWKNFDYHYDMPSG